MDAATRRAEPKDRAGIAKMLARSFFDDPAFGYILPDPATRSKRLERLFALLFDSDLRSGTGHIAGDGAAITLWRSPGKAVTGWGEMIAHALPLIGALGGAIPRALRVADAIEGRFPAYPFHYLHIAGCDPAMQGRGLGGAAIRAGLAEAGSMPCYLETATESNVALYTALGFRVTAEWSVPKGGPCFWSMEAGER
jgi:GNAT superfamily N-acetyltransferase